MGPGDEDAAGGQTRRVPVDPRVYLKSRVPESRGDSVQSHQPVATGNQEGTRRCRVQPGEEGEACLCNHVDRRRSTTSRSRIRAVPRRLSRLAVSATQKKQTSLGKSNPRRNQRKLGSRTSKVRGVTPLEGSKGQSGATRPAALIVDFGAKMATSQRASDRDDALSGKVQKGPTQISWMQGGSASVQMLLRVGVSQTPKHSREGTSGAALSASRVSSKVAAPTSLVASTRLLFAGTVDRALRSQRRQVLSNSGLGLRREAAAKQKSNAGCCLCSQGGHSLTTREIYLQSSVVESRSPVFFFV